MIPAHHLITICYSSSRTPSRRGKLRRRHEVRFMVRHTFLRTKYTQGTYLMPAPRDSPPLPLPEMKKTSGSVDGGCGEVNDKVPRIMSVARRNRLLLPSCNTSSVDHDPSRQLDIDVPCLSAPRSSPAMPTTGSGEFRKVVGHALLIQLLSVILLR
jgi:hypothetical protein